MDEECSAAVDIGAQQPKTFVGRVPRLDHNVVQFVAQEIFHHPLEARLHFQKIAQHADGSQSALHHAGLKEAAHRLGGVAVLIDNGFERSLSAERGGIFSAENVKMSLGLDFVQLLRFDQEAQLADLFGDAVDALADGFEFKRKLAALPAKGFDLNVGVRDFGLQTASVAVGSGQSFFSLRELVAQARR